MEAACDLWPSCKNWKFTFCNIVCSRATFLRHFTPLPSIDGKLFLSERRHRIYFTQRRTQSFPLQVRYKVLCCHNSCNNPCNNMQISALILQDSNNVFRDMHIIILYIHYIYICICVYIYIYIYYVHIIFK